MTQDFHNVIENWWENISHYIHNALVFLDDVTAECLHWYGGLNWLINNKALGARNFSISEKAPDKVRKAVFILSSLFDEETLNTMMAIIRSSRFQNCTVITSLPSQCHGDGEISESNQAFLNMETKLQFWMGNMNSTAKVLHVPLFISTISPNTFIMPAFCKYFKPISSEFALFQSLRNATDHGIKSLPQEMQTNIRMLASCLNALLSDMQMKGDIFSLGPLSHITAAEMETMSQSSKKKVPAAKASVLLIDRSLDLAGPLSQATETPLGKILRILPHLPGHVCDVGVDMTELGTCMGGEVFGLPLLAPGCIAHNSNQTETDILNIILSKKSKEAIMEINRKLVQVGIAEGLSFDNCGKGAIQTLKKIILSYKTKPDIMHKHSGILQQALAVVQTLDNPKNTHLDNLLATEKLLMQNLALSVDGAGDDIGCLISNRKDRNYKLMDVLSLVAFLYALCNDDDVLNEESESSLQASIIEALFQEDNETKEILKYINNEEITDEDIVIVVKTLFTVMKRIGTLRKNLKKYKSVFDVCDPALPATYNPLLKQILANIFCSSESHDDLEYHSTGLKDFIRTGFSLFMNVQKPHPGNNPVLIIMILGGITDFEIKMIHDFANRFKSTKLLVGSTSVLTPHLVMEDLFSVVGNLSTDMESEDE